ncbi:hypothetical protein TrVFT333_004033 [Trichoderma virens FT-333]|nr:hypothetical protein TrVFT333_004033 [Trichoderma virens FT-333]
MSSSPPSPPAVATPDEPHNEGSKLRTFLGILRNVDSSESPTSPPCDSPSSQLLEPTPNLEYWTYLDAPNAFVAIGTSDEPLDRMLEVIRFWLTKDLKYAKGKPCKPYNSCLGEFFRCNWETEDNAPRINTLDLQTPTAPGSSSSSIKGAAANLKAAARSEKNSSSVSLTVPQHGTPSNEAGPLLRISYLTEQTSHHPPVSAFHVTCPEKGITARGFDQITAKFTGTSVKVLPGEHNMGIFISLEKRNNETYQLTHPAAHLGGLFRGTLSVSVSEMAYITCPDTKIKAILHYVEEGWLGRTTNKIDGVIFKYDPENDDKTRVQDVPDEDVLARLSGPWKERVVFTLGPRPLEQMLPNESLRLWSGVTDAILAKQFSKATEVKVALEEAQREKARKREQNKETWKPIFFEHVVGNGGKPDLTEKGKQVLERAQKSEWSLDGIV